MPDRLLAVDDTFTLPAAAKVADTNLPAASKAAVIAAKLDKSEAATTYATKGTAQPLTTALPKLSEAIRTYNDSTKPTIRIIGNGSSVGLGATLPDIATQAPVARLFGQIGPVINRLGNMTLTMTNGSVNGSTIIEGATTHYAAAKTTAGGTPALLVLAYGMNDGQSAIYHNGQTYPAVYSQGRKLIAQANQDGADVIIFTTPHPHTGRNPWGLAGVPSTYPSATPVPADTAGASVVNVTSPSGATVAASYRHLRVNQALRQLAADTGSVLLDAEKHWFDAVAAQGQDALFNGAEYAHPNLLGHQLSYWAAIDDFIKGLRHPTVIASGGGNKSIFDESTIGERNFTVASGGTKVIDIPAYTVGELTIWAFASGAWDSVYSGSVVASSNRVSVGQSSTAFTTPGNAISSVVGSSGALTATITAASIGASVNMTWRYRYFKPF